MIQTPSDPTPALRPENALSRRIPWPVLALGGIALLLLLLIWFGRMVLGAEGASLDRTIMLAMRVHGHPDQPAGPAWLPSAMRDLTALGSSTVLTMVVGITTIFLMLLQRFRTAAMVLGATVLGACTITLVKAVISRARPDIVERLMIETSHSFPSGHAANSAIVYLTLATLLFPAVRGYAMRGFLLATALLVVGAIGVSRVYLGVHWPSDVLAGWCFGSAWALLWWRAEQAWLRPPRLT